MDLAKILQNTGLAEKEAKIYLALLELHESLPSSIARRARVKRPTTYVILEQLQRRGLVSYIKKGKLLYFQALDPHAFLEDQNNKYRALERALPELISLHAKLSATPQMSIFEGEEGLIKIMEDTLTAKTELLCWADVSLAVNSLRNYYPTYIAKKVKRKIWLRGVFCYDPMAVRFKKRGKEELREIYLIPKEKFPFKNEINIYDDKIAIISHEDQIGVIIQNQNIADTQRSIFELGFEYAKILEEKFHPGLSTS
ncbi:hypothetical protein HYW83_06485 [Candidatus Peregrinibacteria bacterium]|nr:hypothetical protein [Candidatus Peregrinibacteria bacterium]